jgi:hypothetical protein
MGRSLFRRFAAMPFVRYEKTLEADLLDLRPSLLE